LPSPLRRSHRRPAPSLLERPARWRSRRARGSPTTPTSRHTRNSAFPTLSPKSGSPCRGRAAFPTISSGRSTRRWSKVCKSRMCANV
jgi:hypothetical protein